MSAARFVVAIVSAGLMLLITNAAFSQVFPSKPIRLLTSGVGGTSDFVARILAQGLTETSAWTVVVENRPSALISAEIAAKAPPDGYVLLFSQDSLWIGPFLQKVPYDPVRDFLPITSTTKAPNVVVVHPSLPVKSVKDLIVLAKAKPGQLNYAAGAIGGSTYMAAELFKSMTSVNIVSVPFKSSGPAVIALVGGELQIMFGSAASIAPHIKSGRLRAVAVTTAEPSALFPGMPTVAATVRGYESAQETGVFAPAGTPATIITQVNREIGRVLKRPDVKEKFLSAGMESVGGSPQEFAAEIQSSMAQLGKVIKDAGIRLE